MEEPTVCSKQYWLSWISGQHITMNLLSGSGILGLGINSGGYIQPRMASKTWETCIKFAVLIMTMDSDS